VAGSIGLPLAVNTSARSRRSDTDPGDFLSILFLRCVFEAFFFETEPHAQLLNNLKASIHKVTFQAHIFLDSRHGAVLDGPPQTK
jgi:hypothetical protein